MSFGVEYFDHFLVLFMAITELFELCKNSKHGQSYRIVKFCDHKPNKTKQNRRQRAVKLEKMPSRSCRVVTMTITRDSARAVYMYYTIQAA